MTELSFQPLANVFPLIEGAEFDELAVDIKANGLHEPIVMFEDMILDGRKRYRACMAAGVEPIFTVYAGDDPAGYVISANLRGEQAPMVYPGKEKRGRPRASDSVLAAAGMRVTARYSGAADDLRLADEMLAQGNEQGQGKAGERERPRGDGQR